MLALAASSARISLCDGRTHTEQANVLCVCACCLHSARLSFCAAQAACAARSSAYAAAAAATFAKLFIIEELCVCVRTDCCSCFALVNCTAHGACMHELARECTAHAPTNQTQFQCCCCCWSRVTHISSSSK